MLPIATSGPNIISTCTTSPNVDGRVTGVVLRHFQRIEAKSPSSKRASGGSESIVTVSQYRSLK
jgi:hypothetical protein